MPDAYTVIHLPFVMPCTRKKHLCGQTYDSEGSCQTCDCVMSHLHPCSMLLPRVCPSEVTSHLMHCLYRHQADQALHKRQRQLLLEQTEARQLRQWQRHTAVASKSRCAGPGSLPAYDERQHLLHVLTQVQISLPIGRYTCVTSESCCRDGQDIQLTLPSCHAMPAALPCCRSENAPVLKDHDLAEEARQELLQAAACAQKEAEHQRQLLTWRIQRLRLNPLRMQHLQVLLSSSQLYRLVTAAA